MTDRIDREIVAIQRAAIFWDKPYTVQSVLTGDNFFRVVHPRTNQSFVGALVVDTWRIYDHNNLHMTSIGPSDVPEGADPYGYAVAFCLNSNRKRQN